MSPALPSLGFGWSFCKLGSTRQCTIFYGTFPSPVDQATAGGVFENCSQLVAVLQPYFSRFSISASIRSTIPPPRDEFKLVYLWQNDSKKSWELSFLTFMLFTISSTVRSLISTLSPSFFLDFHSLLEVLAACALVEIVPVLIVLRPFQVLFYVLLKRRVGHWVHNFFLYDQLAWASTSPLPFSRCGGLWIRCQRRLADCSTWCLTRTRRELSNPAVARASCTGNLEIQKFLCFRLDCYSQAL